MVAWRGVPSSPTRQRASLPTKQTDGQRGPCGIVRAVTEPCDDPLGPDTSVLFFNYASSESMAGNRRRVLPQGRRRQSLEACEAIDMCQGPVLVRPLRA